MTTPKPTASAAAGAHQRRPKRRMRKTSSAPPAPTITTSMTIPLATSPSQPVQLWVTRPTSLARSREIALTGSVSTVTVTASAAAVTAPASTGRRKRSWRRAGGRLTTYTSSPISIASRAPYSSSWPDRKSSARSMNAVLK